LGGTGKKKPDPEMKRAQPCVFNLSKYLFKKGVLRNLRERQGLPFTTDNSQRVKKDPLTTAGLEFKLSIINLYRQQIMSLLARN
jgi:hypothetical protein